MTSDYNLKDLCEDKITDKEASRRIKDLEREEQEKIKEYQKITSEAFNELNHQSILTHIKRKHKQLTLFINLLNLLEEEDNNFKKVFKKELMDVFEIIQHFNLDYFKVLESINFEIETIKRRLNIIKTYDSDIINYFVNERKTDD